MTLRPGITVGAATAMCMTGFFAQPAWSQCLPHAQPGDTLRDREHDRYDQDRTLQRDRFEDRDIDRDWTRDRDDRLRRDRVENDRMSDISTSLHRASRLIGADIEDASGREIGEIDNFIIDAEKQKIAYVIVSTDGRLVAAPWKAFDVRRSNSDRAFVRFNVDRDTLRNAPTIRRNDFAMLGDDAWTRRIDEHYRLQVREGGFQDSDVRYHIDRDRKNRHDVKSIDRDDRTYIYERDGEVQRPLEPRSYMDWYTASETDDNRGDVVYERRSGDRDMVRSDNNRAHLRVDSRDSYTMTNRMISANDLLDADIETRRGEKLGEINDLVVDRNGRVEFVVLSSGGVMGMGQRLHAVPFTVAQVQSTRNNRNMIVLDLDRDRLRSSPSFARDDWNVFLSDTRRMNDVYAFYEVRDGQRVLAYEPARPEFDSPSRLSNADIEAAVRNWPTGAQRAARDLMQRFGQPDEVTSSALIWHSQGFRITAGSSGNSR